MVHHEFHSFRVCIVIESLDVEVRIRRYEVEDIVFLLAKPVFPSDVPALYEYLIESVGSGEVDVFAHLLVSSAMLAVRLHVVVIVEFEVYAWQIIGVSP